MSQEEPDIGAPEGATCAEHRDRMALFKCPRCGRHACLACFHAPVARCVACMKSDPTEASPPLPFEAGDGTLLGRYFRTFGTAFYPWRSAPAFARPGLKRAILFFALSSLPLIMLSGVIPHTRTLLFAAGAIVVQGAPTPEAIAFDVVRAIVVQLGLSAIELFSLLLPFASLVAAYAPERKEAAIRLVLYRFWLGPLAALVGYAAEWSLPVSFFTSVDEMTQKLPPAIMIAALVQPTLRVFQLLAMIAVSRLACGLSVLMSLVVVGVPIALQLLVMPLSSHVADRLLPQAEKPPALQGAPTLNTEPARH
jgi:hypothetical protein